ncbi:MAG: GldG family protein [Planctomycetes bacterium]|nr:GldG family protein [Planctomycetota bacterium]
MNKLKTYIGVVCILVITVCTILIAQKLFRRAGLDLTENKLYTLSKGTRNILSETKQHVHLNLYYSRTAAMKGPEQIRQYNNYFIYVRDLVEEYVRRSGGRLTFSVIDPRPFSDEEKEAVDAGVKQFPLSENESFFFGLVAETELGKQEVIPFFEPGRQQLVEYDLSRAIVNVTRRQKKKIGVLSSLDVTAGDMSPYMRQMMMRQGRQPPEPWAVVEQLKQEYEVTTVDAETDEIEGDIDYLMVIHPKDLSGETLFAIDQYVMKGGRLIVFVDPFCFSDRPKQNQRNPMAAMQQKASSGLNRLLRQWGVEMELDEFASDRNLALKIPVRRNSRPQTVLTYMELGEGNFNKKEIITAQLDSLRVLFAGILTEVEQPNVRVTPLLYTTPEGNGWTPTNPMEVRMLDASAIRQGYTPGDEPLMLGCRIEGKLKTNYPDGPPETEEEESETTENEESDKEKAEEGESEEGGGEKLEEPEVVKVASPESAVVVFSDVDMISDMIAYQDTFFGKSAMGDNPALVLNTIEFLSGNQNLISIRSRGQFQRPFKVVDKIEADAEQATAQKVQALESKI